VPIRTNKQINNQLHAAESFFRNKQFLSQSRNMLPHFMESKYSLPLSQKPATVSDITQTKHNVELTEALSILKISRILKHRHEG